MKLDIADSCTAVRIDDKVYHLDPTATGPSKYIADILPSTAWTSPSFSEDFNIVVGNFAIYKYIPAIKTYSSIKSDLNIKVTKRVWASGNKLLVASWDAGLDSFSQRGYEVQAFVE